MILANTLDAGTHGQDITVQNSAASGDPFTNVYAGITYSTTEAAHGGMSALIPPGSSSSMMFWGLPGTTAVALRMYLHILGHNGAGRGLLHVRHAIPGNALACSMQLATNNRLRVQDKVNGALWTAATDFPIGQWVRVEALIEQGTGIGDGQIRVAYYAGDSTTPLADSGTLSNANLGGDLGPIHELRFGRSFGTMTDALHLDSLAVHSGSDVAGLIGPQPATNPEPGDHRFGYDGTTWVPLTTQAATA